MVALPLLSYDSIDVRDSTYIQTDMARRNVSEPRALLRHGLRARTLRNIFIPE